MILLLWASAGPTLTQVHSFFSSATNWQVTGFLCCQLSKISSAWFLRSFQISGRQRFELELIVVFTAISNDISVLWRVTAFINMTFLMPLKEDMLRTFLCKNLLAHLKHLGVGSFFQKKFGHDWNKWVENKFAQDSLCFCSQIIWEEFWVVTPSETGNFLWIKKIGYQGLWAVYFCRWQWQNIDFHLKHWSLNRRAA